MTAFSHCKPLSLAGMAMSNPKRPPSGVDATIGLKADAVLRHRHEEHQQASKHQAKRAEKLLERLPRSGEVFSILLSGAFDGFDFVPAILDLATPATIDELYIATLGFGQANAGHLISLIDEGKVRKAWFVASCYMRDSKHGDKFKLIHEALTKRGMHVRACRNHAKILAMKLTDGRTFVIDGSLNFCSCKCSEQCHVWSDPALFEFYANYVRTNAEATNHVR